MAALSLALDVPELAEHYGHASVDRQFKLGKQLIKRLGVKPGDRVLDVGSGTGLLAEHVAGVVGPSGSVTAIDPLPLRIEIAKRKARPNLKFAVGDAHDLSDLPDESFDVVYLNAVFHWFSEKLTPLRNFHRLLARGGKLGLSTGSKDRPSRLYGVQQAVLARPPYSAYSQAGYGRPHWVSADELSELLKQSGFDLKSLDAVPNMNVHASPEAAIQHVQASWFGNYLGHLPEVLRSQARQDLLTELAKYTGRDGSIRQTGERLVVVAQKR